MVGTVAAYKDVVTHNRLIHPIHQFEVGRIDRRIGERARGITQHKLARAILANVRAADQRVIAVAPFQKV